MREEYQADFLHDFTVKLPEPSISLIGDMFVPEGNDNSYVIPYIPYSLAMSRSVKQAIFSAASVDNSTQKVVSGKKGVNGLLTIELAKRIRSPTTPTRTRRGIGATSRAEQL